MHKTGAIFIKTIVKKFDGNSYYMGLVQNLYAGKNGSILLFLQFFYQYNLSEKFPQFSECFALLLKNEFENCHILVKFCLKWAAIRSFFLRHINTSTLVQSITAKTLTRFFFATLSSWKSTLLTSKAQSQKLIICF